MHSRDVDALPIALWRVVLTAGALALLALGAWLDGGDELQLQQALAHDATAAQAQAAERERVRTELLPAVRRAYQQGLEEGAERERARVAQLRGQQR